MYDQKPVSYFWHEVNNRILSRKLPIEYVGNENIAKTTEWQHMNNCRT